MNIDLNIENYDLKELLNLFNIDKNFNLEDLKKCKKIVHKIHPDKSNLDKEYFLFFCKAYRILENIYTFRNKRNTILDKNNSSQSYITKDKENDNKKILENIKKDVNFNFNTWFNKTFEELNKDNKKIGYGDWLKSDEDIINNSSINSIQNLHEEIENYRKKLSINYNENSIINIENSNGSFLDSDIEYYSSNLFSKLHFDDLKRVHTENIIPIDFKNKNKNFNNIDQLKNFRNTQKFNLIDEKESINILDKQNKLDNEIGVSTAFKLLKQEEESKVKNTLFWRNLKLLT